MADLTITATVSRTSGGPLSLEDPGVYEIIAFGPGGRSWRRTTVESRFQHGRALLGAVLDTSTAILQVRVKGTSFTQVANRAQTLVDAFSQLTYTLTVTVDGASFSFACEAAEIAPLGGDLLQKYHAMARMQEYQLVIPRHPVPTSGVM
jgi:hypothetical protein